MGSTSGWHTKANARMGMVYAVCKSSNRVTSLGLFYREHMNSDMCRVYSNRRRPQIVCEHTRVQSTLRCSQMCVCVCVCVSNLLIDGEVFDGTCVLWCLDVCAHSSQSRKVAKHFQRTSDVKFLVDDLMGQRRGVWAGRTRCTWSMRILVHL